MFFFSDATREIDTSIQMLNAVICKEMKNTSDSSNPFSSIMCVFNEELLSLSVKQFIADGVQSFLIGIPSRSVSTLLTSYVTLLAPSIMKDNKKGVSSMEDLCKKVFIFLSFRRG